MNGLSIIEDIETIGTDSKYETWHESWPDGWRDSHR